MMEMVGLARALVVFKMDGWVEFHMEGRPGGLLGREREPTDLRERSMPMIVTRTS